VIDAFAVQITLKLAGCLVPHTLSFVSLLYSLSLSSIRTLKLFFDVLLTVHLSIILVTDQLNAQILVL